MRLRRQYVTRCSRLLALMRWVVKRLWCLLLLLLWLLLRLLLRLLRLLRLCRQ